MDINMNKYEYGITHEEGEGEEYTYRFRLEVKSFPNVAVALSELASKKGTDYPIEIVSDFPIGKDVAFQQAYEGVMTEILSAVMQGIDLDLISKEDDNAGSNPV